MKAMTEWYDWGAFLCLPSKFLRRWRTAGTFNCWCVSAAPGRGLAIRSDPVQAGALHPESLGGHHGAQSVCSEHRQVNSLAPSLTQSLPFYIGQMFINMFGWIFGFIFLKRQNISEIHELFFFTRGSTKPRRELWCSGKSVLLFSRGQVAQFWSKCLDRSSKELMTSSQLLPLFSFTELWM